MQINIECDKQLTSVLATVRDKRKTDKIKATVPFTTREMIEEITLELDLHVDTKIGVFSTIEWAIYLKHIGQADVTLFVELDCPVTKKICSVFEINYVVYKKGIQLKFDVIVGNPPYHDGSVGRAVIWSHFVDVALESADIVAMIVPRSLSRSNDYKELRDRINARGISYLSWQGVDLSGKSNDFTDVKVDTLAFITTKDGSSFKAASLDRTPYARTVWFQDSILESIINKLEAVAGENYYGVNNYAFKATKKSTTTGKVMNNMGVAKFDLVDGVVDTNVDTHRVVTSYLNNGKKHLDAVHYAAPGVGVPGKYRQIVCGSADEAQNLVSYLKSDLCVVLHWLTRTSRSIDGPQTRFIPMVDLSRSWSNEEVYAHFGLTAEEISYIEKNL